MVSSRRRRLLALTLLLSGLFGLCVWYGALTPAPQQTIYPESSDIVESPEQYLNNRVVISGTVVGTNPVEVQTETSRDTVFVIRNLGQSVTRGQELSVLGILTTHRSVKAIRSLTVPARNVWYMYLVSGLAGVWTLLRLLQNWTIDWQRLAIRPATIHHSQEPD